MRTLHKLTFVIILLCTIQSIGITQDVLSELTKFESWNISILGTQTDNYELFTQEQKQFALSLLPIIASIVKEVNTRYLSTSEKFNAREMKRQDAMKSLSKQIEDLLLSSDKQALENETRDIVLKRNKQKKTLKEKQKRLKTIQSLKNKDIPMESTLPITLKEQTTYITISHIENLQTIAGTLKAHSLLYYRIYPLSTFMIVEIIEYNVVQRKATQLLRTIVNPKNINQIYNSLKYSLQSAISSSPNTQLQIEAITKDQEILYDAQILLDGILVGFGKASFASLISGTHAISIVYKKEVRTEVVVLEEKDAVLRQFLFDVNIDDTITIQSIPSNVKVYINSEWVGNTPTVIPRPLLIQQMELVEPGYIPYRQSITPTTNTLYSATLTPSNPILLEDRVKQDRKSFYTAFSIFAGSLLLPTIFNGLYINELNASKSGSDFLSAQGKAESQIATNAYLYTFIGTSILSAGLAVYTYIKLQKYLKTASEFHDR